MADPSCATLTGYENSPVQDLDPKTGNQSRSATGIHYSPVSATRWRMRILIVEDDPVLADGLTRSLRGSDYAVDAANDGGEADHVLTAQSYDLVILDLGLPKLDGYEVLRRLRRRGSKTPVLLLTARDPLDDRVKGLELGGDDYLTKPFDLPELEARVRALIRRGQSGGGSTLVHDALTLDTVGRRATLSGEPLDLSARELGVLEV